MRKGSWAALAGLAAVLIWSSGVYAGASIEKIEAFLNHEIMFKVDGKVWIPKDADGIALSPIVYQGSSYLPVRALGEVTGAGIDWDPATKTIIMNTKRGTSGEPYKDSSSYGSSSGSGSGPTADPNASGGNTSSSSVFKFGTPDKPYTDSLFSMGIKNGESVRWVDDPNGQHLLSMILSNQGYSTKSNIEFDTKGIYYNQLDFNFACPTCSAQNPVEVRILTQDGVESAKFVFTNTEKDFKMQGMSIALNGPVSKVLIWARSVSGTPVELQILPTSKLDFNPQ